MTNLVSVVMGPDGSQEKISKIELIPLNSSTAIVIFITDSGYVEHKTINIPSGSKIEDWKIVFQSSIKELMELHFLN